MHHIVELLQDHNREVCCHENGIVLVKHEWVQNGQYGFEWRDITNWTYEDANKWLGY